MTLCLNSDTGFNFHVTAQAAAYLIEQEKSKREGKRKTMSLRWGLLLHNLIQTRSGVAVTNWSFRCSSVSMDLGYAGGDFMDQMQEKVAEFYTGLRKRILRSRPLARQTDRN